ncbi:MAG: hypothetical protein QF755_02845 [Candidatus Peribacteraceae bacterium]|jgi:shikimate 5-dehydrogenase|nr:hypothetical protein [Candidatus Peribacteraceae bacterium]|tara:strand:+ start:659 stop:1045 length:387 start_codon:yes stop_codon:yes gene_type:complete
MTRPRKSTEREIYGIIGKLKDASKIQKEWNAHFKKRGIDAFMAKYPTKNSELPERLSEMFHFDRRMYLVGEDLQEGIVGLLDEVDESRVNVVTNSDGVLVGTYQDAPSPLACLPVGRGGYRTGWAGCY